MNFENLFILDLANNHQGDVSHAIRIIDSMDNLCIDNDPVISIKLQLRDLDTFIHPDYKSSRMAERFLSTRLELEEFAEIAQHIKQSGFILSVTPFDEISVKHAVDGLKTDFLKVASCSATDWSLMEAVAETELPVVVSTGGLSIEDVDKVVSFCEHRDLNFALHHCVSIYPTNPDQMNLWRIQEFKRRYPGLTIGWSTHEEPNFYNAITAAYALGARLFERHIGMATERYPLNTYSSESKAIKEWLIAWSIAVDMLKEKDISNIEQENLIPFKRGYYDGKRMIPFNGEPEKPYSDVLELKHAIHQIKAMLNYANIALPEEFELEFSHHKGIKNFRRIGTTMIEICNRHYAKKLLIMLPGQSHPSHHHKIKDETFQVLYGELQVTIDGYDQKLKAGELATVKSGIWHSFSSENGCIFEEISTTSIPGDSVYGEPIDENRKTKVKNWGRYELENKLK